MHLRLALLCLLLASFASGAIAQGQLSDGQMNFWANELPGSSRLSLTQRSAFLATNPSVADRIGLSKSQRQRIADDLRNHDSKQTTLMADPKADPAVLARNDAEFAKSVHATLEPAQDARLVHLVIAHLGVPALLYPDVADMLGLSASQRHEIDPIAHQIQKRRSVYAAMVARGLNEIPRPKPGADTLSYVHRKHDVLKSYGAERKRMDADVSLLNRKAAAMLTGRQQKTWESWMAS